MFPDCLLQITWRLVLPVWRVFWKSVCRALSCNTATGLIGEAGVRHTASIHFISDMTKIDGNLTKTVELLSTYLIVKHAQTCNEYGTLPRKRPACGLLEEGSFGGYNLRVTRMWQREEHLKSREMLSHQVRRTVRVTFSGSWGSWGMFEVHACVLWPLTCLSPARCRFPHCFSCTKLCKNKHNICITLKTLPDVWVRSGTNLHFSK